jgi:molecular chaperone GrpE
MTDPLQESSQRKRPFGTSGWSHSLNAATDSDSLREQLAEQTDLKLRLAADFENFKRRSRQESEARAAAQKESFIHELLPAIDNLERALASGASSGSPQLHQGVEMTLQQLRLLLRQHGIETEESVGQPFDPHRHEAVSQRHDAAHPNHAILSRFCSADIGGGRRSFARPKWWLMT